MNPEQLTELTRNNLNERISPIIKEMVKLITQAYEEGVHLGIEIGTRVREDNTCPSCGNELDAEGCCSNCGYGCK